MTSVPLCREYEDSPFLNGLDRIGKALQAELDVPFILLSSGGAVLLAHDAGAPLFPLFTSHPKGLGFLYQQIASMMRSGDDETDCDASYRLHCALTPIYANGQVIAYVFLGPLRDIKSDEMPDALAKLINMSGPRRDALWAESYATDEAGMRTLMSAAKRCGDAVIAAYEQNELADCVADVVIRARQRRAQVEACQQSVTAAPGEGDLSLLSHILRADHILLVDMNHEDEPALRQAWGRIKGAGANWRQVLDLARMEESDDAASAIVLDQATRPRFDAPGLEALDSLGVGTLICAPFVTPAAVRGFALVMYAHQDMRLIFPDFLMLFRVMRLSAPVVSVSPEAAIAPRYSPQMLDAHSGAITVMDPSTRKVLYANRAALDRYGDIIGKPQVSPCAHCWTATRPASQLRVTNQTITWIDGRVAHMQKMEELTILEPEQHEVMWLAFHDVLTKLPNRSSFLRDIDEELGRAEGFGAVAFLDLDDFKNINDIYGHDQGDLVLKCMADYFSDNPDTAGHIYRFGGDEFVLLLPGADKPQTESILNTVLERFQTPWLAGRHSFYMTVSIGVSFYPDNGTSARALLKNADMAMYASKRVGKNAIRFYNSQEEAMLVRETRIKESLRSASANQFAGFSLAYQPVISLRSGEWRSVEALARWSTEEFGEIGPDDFIPIAETLGIIVPLGRWVFKTAIEQLAAWRAMGFEKLVISVNVSAKQLKDAQIVSDIQQLLEANGVPPNALILEITEGLSIEVMNNTLKVLDRLRELGVMIALDDFGKGYSSLNYLNTLPMQSVKIDRSFVKNMTSDAYHHSFIRTIVDLAHNLQLTVCAEGVETEEQHRLIGMMRCDHAQGYLFSKPLPAEEITPLFLEKTKMK